jgi:hypothetical protein
MNDVPVIIYIIVPQLLQKVKRWIPHHEIAQKYLSDDSYDTSEIDAGIGPKYWLSTVVQKNSKNLSTVDKCIT